MKLHQEPETVQIATLLTVIGAEARKVFSTFTFDEGNSDRVQPVLENFAAYCQPMKNVPFERYRFYSRMQEAGESYDHYRTVLRQLAERCEFETITADQSYGTSSFSEFRIQGYVKGCFAKRICHWRKLMKFVGRTRQRLNK